MLIGTLEAGVEMNTTPRDEYEPDYRGRMSELRRRRPNQPPRDLPDLDDDDYDGFLRGEKPGVRRGIRDRDDRNVHGNTGGGRRNEYDPRGEYEPDNRGRMSGSRRRRPNRSPRDVPDFDDGDYWNKNLPRIRGDLDDTGARVEDLRRKIKGSQRDADGLGNDADKLLNHPQLQDAQLQEDLGRAKNDIEALKRQLKDASALADQYRDQLDDANDELDDARQRGDYGERACEDAEQATQDLQAKLSALEPKVKGFERKNNELKARLRQAGDRIDDLENEGSRARSLPGKFFDHVGSRIGQLENLISDNQQDANRLGNRIDGLIKDSPWKSAEAASLLDQTAGKVKGIKIALQDAEAEAASYKRDLDSAKDKLNKAAQSHGDVEQANKEAGEDIQQLNKKLDDAVRKVRGIEDDLHYCNSQAVELQRKIDSEFVKPLSAPYFQEPLDDIYQLQEGIEKSKHFADGLADAINKGIEKNKLGDESTQSDLRQLQTDIGKIKSDLENAGRKAGDYESKLKDAHGNLKQVADENGDVKTANEKAKKIMGDLQDNIDNAYNELDKNNKNLNKIKDQLHKLSGQAHADADNWHQRVDDELQDQDKWNRDLRNNIGMQKRTAEALDHAAENLLDKLPEQSAEAKAKVNSVQGNIQDLKKRLNSVGVATEGYEAEQSKIRDNINKANTSGVGVREAYEGADQTLKELQNKLNNTEADTQDIDQQLASAGRELKDLLAQVGDASPASVRKTPSKDARKRREAEIERERSDQDDDPADRAPSKRGFPGRKSSKPKHSHDSGRDSKGKKGNGLPAKTSFGSQLNRGGLPTDESSSSEDENEESITPSHQPVPPHKQTKRSSKNRDIGGEQSGGEEEAERSKVAPSGFSAPGPVPKSRKSGVQLDTLDALDASDFIRIPGVRVRDEDDLESVYSQDLDNLDDEAEELTFNMSQGMHKGQLEALFHQKPSESPFARVIQSVRHESYGLEEDWNNKLKEINGIKNPEPGEIDESFPPDYLSQVAQKQQLINEFEVMLRERFAVVKDIIKSARGEHDPQEVESLVEATKSYFSMMGNISAVYGEKYNKLAEKIYLSCYATRSGLSNLYRQYPTTNLLEAFPSFDPKDLSDEKDAVASMGKNIDYLINSGSRMNGGGKRTEDIILDHFKESSLNSGRVWGSLHRTLLQPIFDNADKNNNPDLHPHTRGYMAARAIQEMCLAMHTHMSRFSDTLEGSDRMYELKRSYETLIKNMRPENWGSIPVGEKRANYISDSARKYIEKALDETQEFISEQFKRYDGSKVAEAALKDREAKNIAKVFSKLDPDDDWSSVEEACYRIEDDSEFARRWFETSLAIFEMSKSMGDDKDAYRVASQKQVVSLLQEFHINEQIPVSALLVATLKNISTADSNILPCLKMHYFKDSDKRESVNSRADNYANKIVELIKKENYKDKESLLRGMTLHEGKPVPYHHDKLLKTARDKVAQPDNAQSNKQTSDVTIHCDLLAPMQSIIKGEKYHSTGEVFASPPMFKKQGLSIRTNSSADPVEIVGIRGSIWKVSPKILLNNPNVVIPFCDPDDPDNKESCGFIPVSNMERTVGDESEGILIPDGESCLLFTLTDGQNWRCRPFGKDLTPEQVNMQKYEGYASLAMAYAAQGELDEEALNTALRQAYKAWSYNHQGEGDNTDQFINDMGIRLRDIKNTSRWIPSSKKLDVYDACNSRLKELFRPGSHQSLTDATALSEANGFEVDRDHQIDKVNPRTHQAIEQLKDKLAGKRKSDGWFKGKESAFAERSADEKGDYFVKASLSASFKLCDEAFIKQLKNEMPEAEGLFSYMEGAQDKFSKEFLKTLVGYEGGLVNPDINNDSLPDNIDSLDMLISKLDVQESNLKGASAELYEKLRECLNKPGINVKDVDDAKKLWIQGRLPTALNGDEKSCYMEWMAQLAQVNWAANRVHCHVNQLRHHKSELEGLDRKKVDFIGKESFKKAACQLNVKLAAIHASITEMSDFLNNTDITDRTAATTRSLFGFMENRNIQLRRHQMTRVPELMVRQMEAIRKGRPDHVFLMEGTGGGKSLCMEAMVDNALNSLAQKDAKFQEKHPVMIIAPDINARQLKHSVGLSEQKNDRSLQDMELLLEDLKKDYRRETFTNEGSLRQIYNVLLGVDRNTPEDNLAYAVSARRSACLLSFSAFQQLLHATEAALKEPSLSPDSEKLINAIRDRFADGVIFGDECVSGPIPYTKSDEQNVINKIKESMDGLDASGVNEESVCKKAIGIMSNCFLFTGLSATKGTAAVGALFAGSDTYHATARELRENLMSTRLRAFDRLSQAKIIRAKNDHKDMASHIVANLRRDQGVTILDTVTDRNSANFKSGDFNIRLAKSWEVELQEAREDKAAKAGHSDDVPSFSTGYIASDGKTMLHDSRRDAYDASSAAQLGAAINASDETSLRASGANFHDNILAYDQGIGSDPIQGKNTAFVITGVFDALEHGRSDLIEQWAGRGTRASNEPYHRQDIFLTVTKDEIDKIKHKGMSSSPEFQSRLNSYEQSEKQVEQAEGALDYVLNQLPDESAIRGIVDELKNEPLNIKYNQRNQEKDIKKAIKVEAGKVTERLVRQLDSFELDNDDRNRIVDSFYEYLLAEEEFQLDAHLLLFTEMATRENNDFTAKHEKWAFKGDAEFFLEKMYGEQELWARKEADDFRVNYACDDNGIDELIDQGFSKTVRLDKSGMDNDAEKIEGKWVKQVLRLTAALDLHKSGRHSGRGFNKNDLNSEINSVKSRYYTKSNKNKGIYLKECLENIGASKGLGKQNIPLLTKEFDKYYSLDNARKGLTHARNDYSNNFSHRERVKKEVAGAFKYALLNVPRARMKEGEDNRLSLEARVDQSEFRRNLEMYLDQAVQSGCSSFKTLDTEMFKALDLAGDNLKAEIEKYIEMLITELGKIKSTAILNSSKYKSFFNNELKKLLSECEVLKSQINSLKPEDAISKANGLSGLVHDYLNSDIKVTESDCAVLRSSMNDISDAIFKIVTGTDRRKVTNNPSKEWNEGGIYIYRPSGKSDSLCSVITVGKERHEFKLALPKACKDCVATYKREKANCQGAVTADNAFKAQLYERAEQIKDDILNHYEKDCQAGLKREASEKDYLRRQQEKMKIQKKGKA